MICNAISVVDQGVWQWGPVDIGNPAPDEVLVKVDFSSLCRTDREIIDGTLSYYQKKEAQYPIITGHEWCGHTDDGPVVGLCILSRHPRIEVGVINRNGAHAEYVIVPRWSTIPIPALDPMYALVEPTAVIIKGLNKINLQEYNNILITGYGTLGRICKDVLANQGIHCVIYDPNYNTSQVDWVSHDLLIECSGNKHALSQYILCNHGTVLAFGFNYIETLGELVSNDIKFIGSLGSSSRDFRQAINIMPKITSINFDMLNIADFGKSLKQNNKVMFYHNSR